MTQRLLVIIVSLWLTAISGLSAQVGFALPFLNNVDSGVYITVPVTVINFDSIVSVQFVVQWDSTILDFDQVLSYNLPLMTPDNFGLADTSAGLVRFAYLAPNINTGISKSDGAAIFRLSFRVTGQINQGSQMLVTEVPPTEFEVVRVNHPPLSLESCTQNNSCFFQNGFVAVGYTVGTSAPGPEELPARISPNPFSTSTTVYFDLSTNEMVQMQLTDLLGKVLEEKKMSLPAGQHGMEIASDQLQENGIYHLILRTATQTCIRSLVKF